MKTTVTRNYFSRIKSVISAEEFKRIENILADEKNSRLESFWNITIAGYPVDFAMANYKKLFEYLQDKPIDYSEALTTFVIYPGLYSGIYFTKTKWFELN